MTPGGHLFLSFGANSINTTEGDTITQGREQMFQWLPAAGDPLADLEFGPDGELPHQLAGAAEVGFGPAGAKAQLIWER